DKDSEAAVTVLRQASELLNRHEAPLTDRHSCASNLIDAYLSMERFEAAESLLRTILSSSENTFVRARAQCQLGLLKLSTGILDEAHEAFDQALSGANLVREEAHSSASGLGLLVRLSFSRYWHEVKNYKNAENLLREAFDLADDGDRLAIVSDLLLTALRAGDTEASEEWGEMFRLLLERQALPPIDRVLAHHILAEQLISSQDNASAEALLRSSLARVSEVPTEALLAPVYNNLGLVLLRLGRDAEAREALDKAINHLGARIGNYRQLHMEILENKAFCQAAMGNRSASHEHAKAAFDLGHQLVEAVLRSGTETERRRFHTDHNLIGFLAELADENPLVRPLLADALFTWKGVIIESVLREQADANTDNDLRVSWTAVQAKMPSRSVLVDYVRYRTPSGRDALGAIIIASGREPNWVVCANNADLRSLESQIEALPSDSPAAFRTRMGRIYDALWPPVSSLFPNDCEQVFICPDSFLRDLPFASLRDGRTGMHLCERFDSGFMLIAARDLLAPRVPVPRKGTWAVYAAERFSVARRDKPSAVRQALSGFGDLKNAHAEWLALQAIGTQQGFQMKRLGALNQIGSSPSILHVITHGTTVQPPLDHVISDSYCLIQEGLEESVRAIEKGKPLELDRDHFFTPTEAAKLKLDETYLVTLSTCRSAEGVDLGGERISGFGRAFTLAGAKNVLLTMWRIHDREAREFMESFYEQIGSGKSASQAMWDTQRLYVDREAVSAAAPFIVYRRFGFGER
ncbi:CHAT domain-containing protein, partial [Verrucomicrobiales bacterium]|nr:CHAT domain-containing protein [Verrucomicrobiales bacterium]